MMTEGKHEETPPEEGDDALWRLLERAPRPKPASPYFARRVLREVSAPRRKPACRRWNFDLADADVAGVGSAKKRDVCRRAGCPGAAGGRQRTGLSSLHRHPSAAPLLVVHPAPAASGNESGSPEATVETDPAPQGSVASSSVSAEPIVTAQDVEVIADLDNLLSREESRLWTEDDTARF